MRANVTNITLDDLFHGGVITCGQRSIDKEKGLLKDSQYSDEFTLQFGEYMFTATGTQTQINTTASLDELLYGTVVSASGVINALYISTTLGSNGPQTTVYLRALDASGQPSGSEIALAIPTSLNAGGELDSFQVAILADGRIVMAFEDETAPGQFQTQTHVRAQVYSALGVAQGPAQTIGTAPPNGFIVLSDITLNPQGGYFISYYGNGPTGQFAQVAAYDDSNVFVGNASSTAAGFLTRGLVGFAGASPIYAGVNLSGQQAVDFPGASAPVSYTGVPSFQSFIVESNTSVIGVLQNETYGLVNGAPGTLTSVINLVRFVDGGAATMFATINVLPSGQGTIADGVETTFIRLADGSFALGTSYSSSTNGFQTQLRHISSSGTVLGPVVELNTTGTQDGGLSLNQLADGTVMATYSGITTATGTDFEVFRELFVIPPPSSVPTPGDDVINGTSGNDTIDSLGGNDTINGLDGDDILTGGSGVDRLFGGAGNDTLNTNAGDTAADGGDGDDTIIFTGAGTNPAFNGGAGYDTFDARGATSGLTNSGQGVTFISTERGLGSAFQDIFRALDGASATAGKELSGFGGGDFLYGASLNDTLNGGAGNDLLDGGVGADILDGGADNDTLSYASATTGAGILFYMLASNLNGGDAAGDTYTSIESVIGTTVNDRIYMDNNANYVSGNGGFDTVELYDGNDIYTGGTGFDYVLGGAGDDSINVASGGSLVYGEDGVDTIFATPIGGGGGATGSNEFYGGAGNDQLAGGIGQDVIFGGLDNDTIAGGSGANFLFGEAGDDVIDGGNDSDQIQGNSGSDTLFGYGGVDVILGGTEIDIISGGEGDDFIFGEDGNDTLIGADGVDQIYGGGGDDRLYGESETDILFGGDGDDIIYAGFDNGSFDSSINFSIGGADNDTIYGDLGQDQMWGGDGVTSAGNDTFVFGANNGFDIVFDFQAGAGIVDQLRLVGTVVSSFTQLQSEARITQAGTYTQINLGGANQIFLANVTAGSLVADDFLFV